MLAGCVTTPEPVERIVVRTEVKEVLVPVPYQVMPPKELLIPLQRPQVEPFVALTDPGAVVGVTAAGLDAIMSYPEMLERRDRAWRAACVPTPEAAPAAP